eukprot:TRINITY_DN70950_c0_g1_i1.p3 TRINITY_DN70950_c0_g1~~TRINITY_DN70950_c0_g1_i1.p3  ORF type:complete len:110 (-),score=5.47 TRINITY_DN70950_c0_g1_i1:54-383(-)
MQTRSSRVQRAGVTCVPRCHARGVKQAALLPGSEDVPLDLWSRMKSIAFSACAGAALSMAGVDSASATPDTAAVGSCLLQSCQSQLAGCIGDQNCLKNFIWFQKLYFCR